MQEESTIVLKNPKNKGSLAGAVERVLLVFILVGGICFLSWLHHVEMHNQVIRHQTALRKCYLKKRTKRRFRAVPPKFLFKPKEQY